jgi:exodeoxyribonuclease VIII
MLVHNMPAADYHAAPALSASGIGKILRSPAHFKCERVETPAMRAGSGLHCAILEPDAFPARYGVMPAGLDRRTNAGKAAHSDIEKSGRIVITADEFDVWRRISDAVRAHPALKFLMESGSAEASIFASEPETEIAVKCRPDWMSDGLPAWIDIKSTEEARPAAFARNHGDLRIADDGAVVPR